MPIDQIQRTRLQGMLSQMLILGFDGDNLETNNSLQRALSNGLSGTILFDYDYNHKRKTGLKKDKNILDPAQLQKLNQQIADANISTYRSVDHEGGIDLNAGLDAPRQGVTRLLPARGFKETLSAKQIGDLYEQALHDALQKDCAPSDARESALVAISDPVADNATLLKEHGFNLVFAPCVDVHHRACPIIGKLNRAYSNKIDTIIDCARAQIDAYKNLGIQCVLKHYPGHGHSVVDSHFGITDVTDSWQSDELSVYKALANDCGMVMLAHLFQRDIDPNFPASISAKHIQMLRRDCDFEGVIMLDDIQMQGLDLVIRDRHRTEIASLSAQEQQDFILAKIIGYGVCAGADMFIIGNQLQPGSPDVLLDRFVQVVCELIQSDDVSVAQIEESYQRITDLKSNIGLSA